MSGYLHFHTTATQEVDALLDLLEEAGNAYHHTEGWANKGWHGEPSYRDQIQDEAYKSSAAIRAVRFKLSELTDAILAWYAEGRRREDLGEDEKRLHDIAEALR